MQIAKADLAVASRMTGTTAVRGMHAADGRSSAAPALMAFGAATIGDAGASASASTADSRQLHEALRLYLVPFFLKKIDTVAFCLYFLVNYR